MHHHSFILVFIIPLLWCLVGAQSCPMGYYNQSDLCIACTPGSYKDIVGNITCTNCSYPYYISFSGSTSGSDCFKNCSFGYYGSGSGCIGCGQGTYKDEIGTNSGLCKRCPSGISTAGTATVSINGCNTCLAGASSDGNSCKACAPGTYKDTIGNNSCTACPFPTFSLNSGSTTKTACNGNCDKGYYISVSTCVGCAQGKYKDETGSSSSLCKTCPTGTSTSNSSGGANSLSNCNTCARGYTMSQGTCVACLPGTYKDTIGNGSCSACPPPNLSANSGAVALADCKGSCAVGYYYSSTSCSACPIGKYKDQIGSSYSLCLACPVGTSTQITGAVSTASCTICDKGYEYKGGVCIACSPGTYKDFIGNANCSKCLFPTYSLNSASIAATGCSSCASGYYLSSSKCVVCPYGTFKTEPGSAVSLCTSCPIGLSTNVSATVSVSGCNTCAAGYKAYSSGYCKSCPPGTFKSTTGNDQCTFCPDGTTHTSSAKTSSSSCNQCSPGYYSISSSIVYCYACAIGSYQPLIGIPNSCTPCPSGLSTATNATAYLTGCSVCAPGFTGNNKSCTACPTGTYKDVIGSSDCVPCPLGSTTEASGTTFITFCSNCVPGYYRRGSQCYGCPQGTYKEVYGIEGCKACPSGYTTTSSATSSASQCNTCSSGFYRSSSLCVACPIGTYKELIGDGGLSTCASCPAGTTTNYAGSSSPSSCTSGPFIGDVRLVPGPSSGRLEVFNSVEWGTVCSDVFDDTDAQVVCRQLGFAGGINKGSIYPGAGVIWMDDVECKGSESRISQCPFSGWGDHDCDHNEDVSIQCSSF